MRIKRIVRILCILLVFALLSPGCRGTLDHGSDREHRPIDKPINTVKDGIPYAKKRALEWGDLVYLKSIRVAFYGKEEFNSRKGTIFYSLAVVKNDSDYPPPEADVRIDMNENAIYVFSVMGDSRNYNVKLSKSEKQSDLNNMKEIQTDQWNIDIDEALEIAIKALGTDTILEYENSNIVLRCYETKWELTVYNPPYVDQLVIINPVTGEIIKTEDKSQK